MIEKMIKEGVIDEKQAKNYDPVNAKVEQNINQIIFTAKNYPNYNNLCVLNQKATRIINEKSENQSQKCVSFEKGVYIKDEEWL